MSRSWTDLNHHTSRGLYSPLLTDTRQYQLLLAISCTKLYAVHSTTGTNYRAETDCRRTTTMEKQIPCFYAPDFFWWLLRHGSDKKRIGKQFVTDPLRYFKMSERQCDIPDPSFLRYRLTDLRLLLL